MSPSIKTAERERTLLALTTNKNKSLHFIRNMTRNKDESKKRGKEKRKEKEREILENGSILYQFCSTDPFNQMKETKLRKKLISPNYIVLQFLLYY